MSSLIPSDRDEDADPSSDGEDTLPSVEDLIAETSNVSPSEAETRWADELDFEQSFDRRSIDAERAWVHLQGLQDHYKHKGRWSGFLMLVLAGMILFQWVLLGFVGAGKWDFTKYEWLLPILLVQNLGQIIGLAFVVVKSLFKDLDGDSQPPL